MTERLLNDQDAGLTAVLKLEEGSAERDELIERGDDLSRPSNPECIAGCIVLLGGTISIGR